jgi:hypothetical protein
LVVSRRKIHLHIDELVLHGVSAHDRFTVQDALESELRRRLADPEFAAGISGSRDVARLDGGKIEVDRRGGAAALGEGLAGRTAELAGGKR